MRLCRARIAHAERNQAAALEQLAPLPPLNGHTNPEDVAALLLAGDVHFEVCGVLCVLARAPLMGGMPAFLLATYGLR